MINDLKKKIEDAETTLANAQSQCRALKNDIQEANQYIEVYNASVEAGKNFMFAIRGLEDGGVPHDLAVELVKESMRLAGR